MPKDPINYLNIAKNDLAVSVDTLGSEQATALFTASQAAATVALAEQQARLAEAQETANLISLLDHLPHPEGREQLHDLIRERLGLA